MSMPDGRPLDGGHAELLDRIYRYQRHIYDLTRKYYLFGRDRMIRELALAPGQLVVEIGCGTGRNLVRIARRYPGTRLYGLDASREMLKTAAKVVRRAGLDSRISLTHGYAEALTPALFDQTQPFDVCLFSYSLSMIPDWKQALMAAARALAPNGRLHIVDFGDLAGLSRVGRRLLLAWLRLFHVSPRLELIATLERRHGHTLRFLPGRYAFLLSAAGVAFLGNAVACSPQKSAESER